MNHEDLREVHSRDLPHKEKVEASIKALQHYIDTYKLQTCCGGNGNIFVDDILYGLGVAIDPNKYSFASGYSAFKELLVDKLVNGARINFSSEEIL